MEDLGFEWVSIPCGRDNLEETLNKMQLNEVEVWNIFEHVVEGTGYRNQAILFTVVGLRRIRKKRQVEDILECLAFAVEQTEDQLKDDPVLAAEGREWLDKSHDVIKSVREDLIK